MNEEVGSKLSDGCDSFQSIDADVGMQEGSEGRMHIDTKNLVQQAVGLVPPEDRRESMHSANSASGGQDPQADDPMLPEIRRESMHSTSAGQEAECSVHDANDDSAAFGQGAAEQASLDEALHSDEGAEAKWEGHGGTVQEAHGEQMQGETKHVS